MGISLWKSMLFFVMIGMIGVLLLPSQRELGKIFTEGRLFREARFYLARQFHDDPQDLANALRYLRALRYSKETDLFEKTAKNLLANDIMARSVEVKLVIAEFYEDTYRFDRAAVYWDEIVRQSPARQIAPHLTADELRWKLISYYNEHKNFEKLISFYEWALKRDPGQVETIEALARLYALRGNFKMAEEYTTQLCRINPRDEKAILAKAEYCELKGANEEALVWYEKAFRAKPGHLKTGVMFAQKLIQYGKRSAAQDVLARLHQNFPESADINLMIADLYIDAEQWSQAIPLLEFVVSKDPDSGRVIKLLADAYYQAGQYAKAEEAILRYHEKTGGDYHTHHLLGDILGDRGDRDGSRRSYERALELIRSPKIP